MNEKIPTSPYEFFDRCFEKAKTSALAQYDSMVLITATPEGIPSGRIVLLKSVVPSSGFRFFTNFESRKSGELFSNPNAQLLFYWPSLGRQIRIEGKVQKLSAPESDDYWATRPRGSQIGAIASLQSRDLESLEEMDREVAAVTNQWDGKIIARPPNWGGFELQPTYFEFWEDRTSRLHERVTFTRVGLNWKIGRLWP